MPHFVIKLTRPRDSFAVYSTIVDNLISPSMGGAEMRAYLEEREYTSWLTQGGDSLDDLVEKYGDEVGRMIHDDQTRVADWFYWDEEHEFKYAKEADHYFVPPRRYWRNN